MPAHQHCDLFYPLGWGSDWVYHKLGNAPFLQSGTGSWVLSGESGVHHLLSPVIRLGLRNPRKKERKEKWAIIMDKRQEQTAASTQAETSGLSAQDRYCVKAQEEARRNGVETETHKDKSSSCDVAVTYDDVRCFL